MPSSEKYIPNKVELRLMNTWQTQGTYHFDPTSSKQVFSIDTPPPTVSGHLHLGHVYSYSHADFIARFWRMNGRNVYYPMGYDDNGLPTERLVEKRLNISASQIGRAAFIEKCLEISDDAEKDYKALWQRLGLSIDWRYTYRTIEDRSRRACQLSFIELNKAGLAYRRAAPAIWCPECRTSIAQAELNDIDRQSEFITIKFYLSEGDYQGHNYIPIATTRPELLSACVAIFVHPDDQRFAHLHGMKASVPLLGREVPILVESGADPEKGTGAVMCCTFGDTADIGWWRTHKLPLIEAIGRDGRMTSVAGDYAGLTTNQARKQIKEALDAQGFALNRQPTSQSIRVHERCDTPVEYIMVHQWFIQVLNFKDELLAAGEQVKWYPDHMQARYRAWVENLNWDWGISRQRYFGVPFPVWYCEGCGATILADVADLPVDPTIHSPSHPCTCGSTNFSPDEDIFDTWATSSLSPQIAGQFDLDTKLNNTYDKVFPYSMRPQAHEIIRTWAFYTIVQSHFHFKTLPWKNVLISGWGLAGEGMGKISKSRGGGPMAPLEMIERYSADAVRYWAASTGIGKDSIISEEKIQTGAKLVTKLWNVARFSEPFLNNYAPSAIPPVSAFTPADRWMLSSLQQLIRHVTQSFTEYDYSGAKNEIESFFWYNLTDNYLEMCKMRLYNDGGGALLQREGALYTLHTVLTVLLKLFAPLLPYVTEEIYLSLFSVQHDELSLSETSIHTSNWPTPEPAFEDPQTLKVGEIMIDIATTIRRYKSEHNISLGKEIARIQLFLSDTAFNNDLTAAIPDLMSITRARKIELVTKLDPTLLVLKTTETMQIALEENI